MKSASLSTKLSIGVLETRRNAKLKEISELNRSIIKAYVPTKRARAANRAIIESVRGQTPSPQ